MSYQYAKNIAKFNIRSWLIGLLLLSGLILIVTHFVELEHFADIVRRAKPKWLILALLLQIATYISVSVVWYIPLKIKGEHQSLWSLIPLGVAKLFVEQSVPSAGMSGTAFFVAALKRRGINNKVCMATLLLSLVSYYGAYLIVAILTVMLLYFYHKLNSWIILVSFVFAVIAVGIPGGALLFRSIGKKKLPNILHRVPRFDNFMKEIASSPVKMLRNPGLIFLTIFLQLTVFLLDSATLLVMLKVVSVDTSFWVVFPSFIFASMVATVGPIPLGLGTFEITCVTMLSMMKVPIEAALSATLLLRGFTLWLPMLPGMWMTKWALS
jgi:uncharacterized protein (TIRG00374 family)